ncbi:hypothetical protein ACOSQ4_022498 [Xanthoceras sorbifolium]
MQVPSLCPIYRMQPESISHSLWFCKSLNIVRKSWSEALGCSTPKSGSLIDFLLVCKNQIKANEFVVLLILLWRLWFCRNHFIHAGTSLAAKDCWSWAKSFADDFQVAALLPGHALRSPAPVQSWRPPGDSLIKMNSDATTCLKSNRAGFGVVFQNHSGHVLMSAAASSSSCFSPLVLEALSLKRGLELARDASLLRLVIESDCVTLVKAINSVKLPLSEVGNIIKYITVLIHCLGVSCVSFAPRNANRVVDVLSKFSLSLNGESIWMEDVPPCVFSLILEECSSPL